MDKKIKVGVLGATGAVGQRFIQLLDQHPWFEVTHLYASERSANKKYSDATIWRMDTVLPAVITDMIVRSVDDINNAPRLVFSALDSSVATKVEQSFAQAGCVVVSNSKNHRMDPSVPLVIPEVNPSHLSMVTSQQSYKNGGFIVTNPNCTTVGLTLALAPLYERFAIKTVSVVSMQAASGAGYPGVPSLDLIDNVVPYIDGEEDKIITEPKKILGLIESGKFIDAQIAIDATCNRVGVRDGHLEAVALSFNGKVPSLDTIREAIENFCGEPQRLNLPSAPNNPLIYSSDPSRPQPSLDRMNEQGMAVTIGRLRSGEVHDVSFTLLVHNTIRGAAGAAILNAELLQAKGYLDW